MAFTKIKIDNLFCFENSTLDLSFARSPVNSTLEGEYIDGFEKFYFKKVCVISGANASGKTSLGRVMLTVLRFLSKGVFNPEPLKINDHTKPAYIEVDFFQRHLKSLFRAGIWLKSEDGSVVVEKIAIASVELRKTESCAKTTKRLDSVWSEQIFETNGPNKYFSSENASPRTLFRFIDGLDFILGWHFVLSANQEDIDKFSRIKKNILAAILKTFDSTIKSVSELTAKHEDGQEEIQGYSVVFNNNDKVIIDMEGGITNKDRLSRGTYEAVKISHLLSGVLEDQKEESEYNDPCSGIYFLDEKMAFTHTELEKMIVTLIISKLCRYGQFIYTTHNYDILSLDLPTHSFTFTKKTNGVTTFVEATEEHKKNDRNLLNTVKNDTFGTIPDVSLIEEMLFED
ncbi:ATP-binding protein [Klebsiella pneumoniae]|uniref:ATP-binding protein n=1 Tax=Klebsiella pneumoniae complex TaxID=3390273 RepID=UPI000DE7A93A|nr:MULTISPECIES: ATP-binding protein [Klebsiella]MBK2929005.1 ATP-binding protein [Klebsiella pneumoniae]MBK2966033.1 ATP-binding protein [Klebsiella pneumoniae]MDZ3697540.1 ATP-binding protein [Klebsiella pneumoniae]MDZ3785998.1 ATP-binding protein [Klebsiella pneumoniae]MDZ3801255.1 ATP-binding protein [Klebsiella pneumoniae]